MRVHSEATRPAPDTVPGPTAARTLVAALRAHGMDRVFCVAGESYLAVRAELIDNAIPREQFGALSEADLILAVGTRPDGTTTRHQRLPAAPVSRQPLVHIYFAPAVPRYGAPAC